VNHASSFGEALLRLPTISRRSARKLRRTLTNLRGRNATQWRQLLEQSPVTHWLALAEWITRDRARTPLTEELSEAIRFATQTGSPDFLSWAIEVIADRLHRRVSPATIRAWIEIRGGLGLYAYLPKKPACREFPLDRVLRFADNDTIAVAAWHVAMKWPGAILLLNDPRIDHLPARAKEALLELAEECRSFTTVDARSLLEAIAALDENLKPEDLTYALWRFPSRVISTIVARWGALAPNSRRGLEVLIPAVREASCETISALAALDARVFIEAAGLARRDNRSRLVCDGLSVCFETAPQHTLAWLARNAEAAFDFAAALITLGEVRARTLLRAAVKHDLFAPIPDLANNPGALVAFDRLLTDNRAIAQHSPHFRTWDLHFSGAKVLGKIAIENTGARLKNDVPLLQIRHLESQARTRLAVSKDKHACVLHAKLEFARRPLARFLKSYETGEDRRLEHPSNRCWFSRIAAFNRDIWLRPPQLTLPVEGFGDVTIAPEYNPYELLKLGTYVDSCLSAWSFNGHNAVAVLLDANKRVLYARNSKGHFLGRQIVAITNSNTLACHRVYALREPKPLEDLFALYDQDLAMQLGISIAKRGDDSHQIEPLVVRQWYDDGLWDRF
jgi:hypothetical protein